MNFKVKWKQKFAKSTKQPIEGDYEMTPCGILGEDICVGEVDGKYLGRFKSEKKALLAIKQKQDKEQFWSDIWYKDDHGGLSIITDLKIEKKK